MLLYSKAELDFLQPFKSLCVEYVEGRHDNWEKHSKSYYLDFFFFFFIADLIQILNDPII